jgi:hypothetical protein
VWRFEAKLKGALCLKEKSKMELKSQNYPKKIRKNTCFLQTCKELRVESPTKQKIKIVALNKREFFFK